MDETQAGPSTAAGWFPDPYLAGTMRYWDGAAWTDHTATGYDHPAPSAVHAPYQRTVTSRPQLTFGQANQQSLVAIGFAIGYLVLAQFVGIVFLGIVPVMSAVRAVQRKEPLAPVAVVVAGLAIVLGLLAMTSR